MASPDPLYNSSYQARTEARRRKAARRRTLLEIVVILLAVAALWGLYTWLTTWTGRVPEVVVNEPWRLPLEGSLEDVKTGKEVPVQIVRYPGFTVNFNKYCHMPNYVVWELTADEVDGPEQRLSKFFEDKSVEGCATLADYKKSGFSRGHMAPAADMKWSAEAMRASHNLSNVCPQQSVMNSGAWSTLEGNCRAWALRDSALVIIAGPVLTDRMPRHIGPSRVPVPERFFKVVLAPYVDPPRGIGFVMPNARVEGGVQACAMTIDEVEDITGLDFFGALLDDIENEVESHASYPLWQTLK